MPQTFNNKPWTSEVVRDPGHECPACTSFVKTYNRRLSSSIARCLLRLYDLTQHNPDTEFFHVKRFGFEAKEVALLAHWGLMLEAQNEDTSKRTSGYWKITESGIDFVRLRFFVPLYIVIHLNNLVGFAGAAVSIQDCLERNNSFDYLELMDGIRSGTSPTTV
jgi:hypothetical protein